MHVCDWCMHQVHLCWPLWCLQSTGKCVFAATQAVLGDGLVLRLVLPLAQDRAFNDRRYYIGSSKLAELGWRERTSWEVGLRKTIDW